MARGYNSNGIWGRIAGNMRQRFSNSPIGGKKPKAHAPLSAAERKKLRSSGQPRGKVHGPAPTQPAGEATTIDFMRCRYRAQCKVKNCTAPATIVALGLDAIGRPGKHYELCALHAEQVAERERAKGREILRR